MQNSYLIPLLEHAKPTISDLGKKGLGLFSMAKAGLKIPRTWSVPVWVMQECCSGSFETHSTDSQSYTLPNGLIDAIENIFGQHHGSWFVRSSGLEEDGDEQSFAGQFASFGGLKTKEELQSAIKEVWKSYFSEAVQSYRQDNTLSRGMAVLIQEEIPAVFAGVIFSQNPISGNPNELIIESTKGKGEDLVSAKVVPGRSAFWYPKRWRAYWKYAYRHLLQKEQQEILSLPSKKDQRRLCRAACIMELHTDKAQDIEWVINPQGEIYFVQSRPITSRSHRSSKVLWTRQFLGERWTIPATQLGWSEIEGIMLPLIDYRQTHLLYMGGGTAARVYQHSPYLNATVFRHLLLKLPFTSPAPSFFLEMLPSHEKHAILQSWGKNPDWRVYFSIISTTITEQRWKRFRWNPFTNYQKWDGFVLRLNPFLARHRSAIQSVEEAYARIEDCRMMSMEYLKVHVCSLIYANLWHQWGIWRLKKEGLGNKISILLRAHRRTATQRANHALWLLGNQKLSMEALLDEFEARSENSWAIFAPRWGEVPDEVRRLARWMQDSANPEEEENHRLKELEQEMKNLPRALRAKLRIVQHYLFLREEQRFHFEKLLFLWKKSWLWLEKNEGIKLRFLRKEEVEQYKSGALNNAVQLCSERERAWKDACLQWTEQGGPPQFLIDDQPLTRTSYSKELQGIGISAGYVEGKVRWVRNVQDAEALEEGEILLVNTLDPGWTPLLIKAGGLIMELGGMLSHGAVIAREYQVPSVAAVDGACSILTDGMTVGLDGDFGVVLIIDRDESDS